MKIAINAEKLNSEQKTGVEFYVKNLLEGMSAISDLPKLHLFVREELKKETVIPKSAQVHVLSTKYFYGQWGMPRAVKKASIDVYFEPARPLPLAFSLPNPVFTVHDLAYVKYPEAYNKRYSRLASIALPRSIRKAKRVIAVSESTKKDIIETFHAPEEKIKVTYLAANIKEETPEKLFLDYKAISPYFIFIGRLEARKNIVNIIKAFKLLRKERGINPKLLLVGRFGFGMTEIEEEIQKAGSIKDSILITGYLPEEEKYLAYKNSLALIFPSFYEGFGLPVLEAMTVGVPVITSPVSSLPEVAGKAVLFVDPKNPLEIAAAMSKVVHDKKLTQDLIDKGKKQAKKFSWQKTAEETLEILISAAENRKEER